MPVIDILSLFPQTIRSVLDSSILRRAQLKGRIELASSDLRDFAQEKYNAVDDSPFGGRQGMLFMPDVLESAFQAQLKLVGGQRERLKIIYPSPRGASLDQAILQKFSEWLVPNDPAKAPQEPASLAQSQLHGAQDQNKARRICILCGRYEGIDERIVNRWVDLEVSVGDFILTGGELPALMVADGLVRLLPGVLGDERSNRDESFSNGLLEYPQYTKPREFMGLGVPAELLSGHHAKIDEWKLKQSLLLTFAFRPDLIRGHSGHGLPKWAFALLEQLKVRLECR